MTTNKSDPASVPPKTCRDPACTLDPDHLEACPCEPLAASVPVPVERPTQTDLDRRIESLLAEADKRTGPGPLANGGDLIQDLASVLRIVLQEQKDCEAAWEREHARAEAARAIPVERGGVRLLGIYTTAGRFICAACVRPLIDAVEIEVVPGDAQFHGADCMRCGAEVEPDDAGQGSER